MFIENVMRRILLLPSVNPSKLDAETLRCWRAELATFEDLGYTEQEALDTAKCWEEVDPSLKENVALLRMKIIANAVKARSTEKLAKGSLSRDQFEAWYRSLWPNPILENEFAWTLRWKSDEQRYSDSTINLAWRAWQASESNPMNISKIEKLRQEAVDEAERLKSCMISMATRAGQLADMSMQQLRELLSSEESAHGVRQDLAGVSRGQLIAEILEEEFC